MKKRFALILAVLMACNMLVVPSFAASAEAEDAANALYELGLFQGTGKNADGTPIFDLDRTPTRAEAITMLVRLLGKETEVKQNTYNTPFTDVADWAKPYVGYAYENGLTTGTGANTFGGGDTVTASQYITFVLRALGYDSGADFQWDKAWELSDKLGFTTGQYNASSAFTRGDVAIISYNALSAKLKGTEVALKDRILSASSEKASLYDYVVKCVKENAQVRTKDAQSQQEIGWTYVYSAAPLNDQYGSTIAFTIVYSERTDPRISVRHLIGETSIIEYELNLSKELSGTYTGSVHHGSDYALICDVEIKAAGFPNDASGAVFKNISSDFEDGNGNISSTVADAYKELIAAALVRLRDIVLDGSGYTLDDMGFKSIK